MKIVAIWLDDLRDPFETPWKEMIENNARGIDAVIWAKDVHEFQFHFEEVTKKSSMMLHSVFFDNDLGSTAKGSEGRNAFTWMEEQVRTRNIGVFGLHAQTANVVAKKEIESAFRVLKDYWNKETKVWRSNG